MSYNIQHGSAYIIHVFFLLIYGLLPNVNTSYNN